MADKLTEFLTRNDACIEVLARLAATGAATPEEAFERADDRDLVWAVTRPGVMSADQRRSLPLRRRVQRRMRMLGRHRPDGFAKTSR